MPPVTQRTERKLRQMQFERFPIQQGDTGRTIHVSRCPQDIYMDYNTTLRALEIHELQLVRHQVLIPGIDANKGLKERFKGNWSFVAGEGPIYEDFAYHNKFENIVTWNPETGELRGLGNETDIEKIIRLLQGPYHLSLRVHADSKAELANRRYCLSALERDPDKDMKDKLVVGYKEDDAVTIPKEALASLDMQLERILRSATQAPTRELEVVHR